MAASQAHKPVTLRDLIPYVDPSKLTVPKTNDPAKIAQFRQKLAEIEAFNTQAEAQNKKVWAELKKQNALPAQAEREFKKVLNRYSRRITTLQKQTGQTTASRTGRARGQRAGAASGVAGMGAVDFMNPNSVPGYAKPKRQKQSGSQALRLPKVGGR